jgi:hypothetical protein
VADAQYLATGSPGKPRSPAAERMRLYRQRRRHQLRVMRLEIAAAEIEELVKRGYLDPKYRGDLSAIEFAAGDFLSATLGGWA